MDNENNDRESEIQQLPEPQYDQGPPPSAYQPEPAESSSQWLAVASLICGIISILSCCCWVLSGILAVVAIVLGIIAIKKNTPSRGMAIAGIATGGTGILLTIISIVFIGFASIASYL